MAKTKNNKILAMALCASVMAGIYASPVMAAEVEISGPTEVVIKNHPDYADSIIYVQSGTFNLNGEDIAAALEDQLVSVDTLTVGTEAIGEETVEAWNNVAKNTAGIVRQDNVVDGKGITEIEKTLVINGQSGIISTFGGQLTIDGSGNVKTTGDLSTSKYTLNTVGDSTTGVRREGDENTGGHKTIIEEQLVVNKESGIISNKNASFTVDRNGNLKASTGNVGGVEIANGEVDGVDVSNLKDNIAGIVRKDVVDDKGITEIENTLVVNGKTGVISNYGGQFTLDASGNVRTTGDVVSNDKNKNYSLNTIGENTAGIRREGDENSGGHRTIIEEQLVVNKESGTISNKNASFTVDSNGNLKATSGDIGGLNIQAGYDGNNNFVGANVGNVHTINGALVEAVDGGGISISGVELHQGLVNGIDVNELNTTVGKTSKNVAGIEREAAEGAAAGEGITTIEKTLTVNGTDGSVTAGGVRMREGRVGANAYLVNGGVNALTAEGLKLGEENLDEAQLANINNVIQEGGNIVANSVNVGDGAVMANADGSLSAANNAFRVTDTGKMYVSEIVQNTGGFYITANGQASLSRGQVVVDYDGNLKLNSLSENGGNIFMQDGATVDGVDVSGLKTDADLLRKDVGDLRTDTNVLRTDVNTLRDDTNTLRTDVNNIDTTLKGNVADISDLQDKTQGIDHWADNTTYYNGAISATGSISAGGVGDEAKIGGDTKNGGYLQLKDSNDEYQVLNADKLATINNVITDEGEINSLGDVTSTDGTNTYHLNTVGVNTAGIRRANNGTNNVTIIEENLKVYDDGTIVAANENFKVNKDGNVFANAVNVADGAVVISENGINAYNNKFTVNPDGGITAAGGANLAEGMFTASAGGVTMANDKVKVDTEGNILAGTYNGVEIGKTAGGDITLDGVVIDDKFNSKNVAGIERVEPTDGEPGSEVTYIEKNTAISKDGVEVKSEDGSGSAKVRADGFYVKNGSAIASSLTDSALTINGQGVASVADDGVVTLRTDKIVMDGQYFANTTDDGISVSANNYTAKDDVTGESVRVKADGVFVKNSSNMVVSSLTDDSLMLTDEESGAQNLTATDIADIKGIDRTGNEVEGYTTTIEGATSFTKDGMVTSNLTTDSFTAGITEDSIYHINAKGEMLFISGDNVIGMNRNAIGFISGNESVTLNESGTTFATNGETATTTIKGGTITTDTLNVETIVLGDKLTDEDGNSLELSADGIINIKENGETVFGADTDNLQAHYGDYNLNMNADGFVLDNTNSSFTLSNTGFAFSGPVNLGKGAGVGFTYNDGSVNGQYITLDSLVDKVNDIYNRTDGIYKDAEGNTVVTDGNWNAEAGTMDNVNSSVIIGEDGATFESTNSSGVTNINGGTINTDKTLVGDYDDTAGGGTGTGTEGSGVVTDSNAQSGSFVNGVNSNEFTSNAWGTTGTVTDEDSNTQYAVNANGSSVITSDNNGNYASHWQGIGENGVGETTTVVNDSTTVIEENNVNGNSTTVNNGNIAHNVSGGTITNTVNDGTNTSKVEQNADSITSSVNGSTVAQDGKGQTIQTATGTTTITGGDIEVYNNKDGQSIKVSDIGYVDDIESGIQNQDGTDTTVVDAVNNEYAQRVEADNALNQRVDALNSRVDHLEDRIDKVGAMAAAIANLRTMGYDPAAPTEVAVGLGQYRDETGAALGLFHYPNRDFMLSLSVSTSGDEVMGGIGATWKFGRKSPEKVAEIKKAQADADVRRAEEAKLAKAEEMKKAAKEAKIKAQQERHAKLAAERAAQAESK